MVAVCQDLCVSAPLRLGVKIGRAEIKGNGRATADGEWLGYFQRSAGL
jgi:hypothetical protein